MALPTQDLCTAAVLALRSAQRRCRRVPAQAASPSFSFQFGSSAMAASSRHPGGGVQLHFGDDNYSTTA